MADSSRAMLAVAALLSASACARSGSADLQVAVPVATAPAPLVEAAAPTGAPAPPPPAPDAGPPPALGAPTILPTLAPAAGLPCGTHPTDWCPGAAGDPCGAHHDKASCQADAKCQGVRYRGESLVACSYDARGFATNCPTVGCVSL